MKRRRYPLSKMQRRVLRHIAKHGAHYPCERLRLTIHHDDPEGSNESRSIDAMIRRGLLGEGPGGLSGLVFLRITPAGRRALSRGWR